MNSTKSHKKLSVDDRPALDDDMSFAATKKPIAEIKIAHITHCPDCKKTLPSSENPVTTVKFVED